jgi:hypothetical protein
VEGDFGAVVEGDGHVERGCAGDVVCWRGVGLGWVRGGRWGVRTLTVTGGADADGAVYAVCDGGGGEDEGPV